MMGKADVALAMLSVTPWQFGVADGMVGRANGAMTDQGCLRHRV